MSTNHAAFAEACKRLRTMQPRPDNASLLRLYALYKQATAGDAHGPRPAFFDAVGHAKREAWAQLCDMPQQTARQEYIDLVDRLARHPQATPPPLCDDT